MSVSVTAPRYSYTQAWWRACADVVLMFALCGCFMSSSDGASCLSEAFLFNILHIDLSSHWPKDFDTVLKNWMQLSCTFKSNLSVSCLLFFPGTSSATPGVLGLCGGSCSSGGGSSLGDTPVTETNLPRNFGPHQGGVSVPSDSVPQVSCFYSLCADVSPQVSFFGSLRKQHCVETKWQRLLQPQLNQWDTIQERQFGL